LTYDAVTGDPWVRVEAETGQVLGLITDMKIELDQAQHFNADQAAFETFCSISQEGELDRYVVAHLHFGELAAWCACRADCVHKGTKWKGQ
jgi:hypothetical protein